MANKVLELLGVLGGGYALYSAALSGNLGPNLQGVAASFRSSLGPVIAAGGGAVTPCPTASELAAKLGVTAYRVSTAMAAKGKNGCTLTLADLQGIPDLPASVLVGGVVSVPNPTGPPATFANPTGGSGTWGGLNDAQIQAAFLAANNNDPAAAAAAWAAQHAAEVLARGY